MSRNRIAIALALGLGLLGLGVREALHGAPGPVVASLTHVQSAPADDSADEPSPFSDDVSDDAAN